MLFSIDFLVTECDTFIYSNAWHYHHAQHFLNFSNRIHKQIRLSYQQQNGNANRWWGHNWLVYVCMCSPIKNWSIRGAADGWRRDHSFIHCSQIHWSIRSALVRITKSRKKFCPQMIKLLFVLVILWLVCSNFWGFGKWRQFNSFFLLLLFVHVLFADQIYIEWMDLFERKSKQLRTLVIRSMDSSSMYSSANVILDLSWAEH